MVLSLIGTHCTDIESIGLAGWQGLHYEHLKALLQDCPRLGKLDLSDVSVSTNITEKDVEEFGNYFEKLCYSACRYSRSQRVRTVPYHKSQSLF